MIREIIGKKLGMTRLFSQEGNIVPVTIIEAGPCPIIQKKTREKDGYGALQVGFLPKKPKRVNRPLMGHFKKSGEGAFYILRELRMDDVDDFELGQEIAVDIFQPGDLVDVTGTSKGRGFSGVMKRHGFRGAPGSHGTHEYFRHGGSIGSATDPGRTYKGKRMPGHFGNQRVTVQNIEVVEVRAQQNLIFLKGSIPGWRNGIVTIRGAKKATTPPRPAPPRGKREEPRIEEPKKEAVKQAKTKVREEVTVEAEAKVRELPEGEANEKSGEEGAEAKEATEERPKEDVKEEATEKPAKEDG